MNIITTKRGRIAISWVVCITMIFASFAGPFAITDAQAAIAPPITVDKAVVGADWIDKDNGIAKIKLTVNSEGVPVIVPSVTRIVLVLDYSSSMKDKIQNTSIKKIEKLRTAANKFVDDMLVASNGDIQIAVVRYAGSLLQTTGFQNATNKDILHDAISENTGSGTHTQAGIYEAKKLLKTVATFADNEFMLVFSDGEPNRSYKAKTTRNYDPSIDSNYNYNNVVWPTVVSEFDYSQSGSNNHNLATVSEALLAKKDGTTIYSIGFDIDANSTPEKIMKSVASSNSNYVNAASSDNLSAIFANIGTKIIEGAAGAGAVVTDPMGYNMAAGDNYAFKAIFNDSNYPVTITNPDNGIGIEFIATSGQVVGTDVTSSFAYDTDNDTFTWNLTTGAQKVKKGTYTLTYYVQIQGINGDGVGDDVSIVETNHVATLMYTPLDGDPVTRIIPDPTLPVAHYTIEYYFGEDMDSMAINPLLAPTKIQAAIAGRTPVTVTAPLFPGYDYAGTVYGNDDAAALDIVQDGANNVIKIYYIDKPELPGTWTPDVIKYLNGETPEDGMFQFKIEKVGQIVEGDPVAEPYSQTVSNIGTMIPFTAIPFSLPGTYTFDISEIDLNVPGFTYDRDVIRATVVVSEGDDNTLVAQASYNVDTRTPVFNNYYEGPGSIEVTKKMIVLTESNDTVDYTFFAALFENIEGTMVRVRDAQVLKVEGSVGVTTAFFDKLDLDKKYYVFETDVAGNILQNSDLAAINPIWTNISYANNEVTLDIENMKGATVITNTFDPIDFPLTGEGTIRVNKSVMVNDKLFDSNRTFYVALFKDKELKNIASVVKELKMNGSSSTFVTFDKDKAEEPLFVEDTYYVAETDKNGVPLTGTVAQIGFEIQIDKSMAVVTKEGTTVNIINKFKTEEFPLTGDNSNMGLWLFLAMLGVAGAIAPFAFRKKEVAND